MGSTQSTDRILIACQSKEWNALLSYAESLHVAEFKISGVGLLMISCGAEGAGSQIVCGGYQFTRAGSHF